MCPLLCFSKSIHRSLSYTVGIIVVSGYIEVRYCESEAPDSPYGNPTLYKGASVFVLHGEPVHVSLSPFLHPFCYFPLWICCTSLHFANVLPRVLHCTLSLAVLVQSAPTAVWKLLAHLHLRWPLLFSFWMSHTVVA